MSSDSLRTYPSTDRPSAVSRMLPTVLVIALLLLTTALPMGAAPLGTAQEEVWVSLGEDLFEALEASPWVLGRSLPLEAVESGEGVVITRLPESALHKVSNFAHYAANRCSGFIVHQDLGEARAALEASRRNVYRMLPVQFQISQQTLVNQLQPAIAETNILSTIDHLSTAYNNRYYLNTSGQTSALWIRDLWQGYATGRSDVTVSTYTHSGYPQPSVILTIQGSTLPDEVVVLGGHLDSIRSGSSNNASTIAPGADDNASGIASLSEAIRVLMANGVTFDRTVKFMGYAAEEVGLRGSGDIAADHQAAGTNVVAVMQLDMTDFNGSAEDIALIDDNTNAELSTFVGQLVDTYQSSLVWTTSTCGYACSDHASWHNQGYPAVMPFEAKLGQHNSAIHGGSDTLATLGNSAAHAAKFSRLALAFALETGLADCTPSPIADAGSDRTICLGDSTELGSAAQAGHSYSWNPGGATTALYTVSPTATTNYTVTATTSCGSAQDAVQVTVDSSPTCGQGCTDCVDWSTTGTVSYSNQDNAANVTVEDGGDTLLLLDNTWRRTTQTYTITPDTMLELDFRSTNQGEIQGIGFDENDTLTDAVRIFQLHGTQNWGSSNHDFDNYAGGGVTTHYTIPVGQYYTGTMFLVTVNDNDAGSGNDSRFSNVRIYENTPPPGGCATEVDFESGVSGWVNSAASTCSTGSFVAATPTSVSNGGVTTQVGGDHTTGSGNAFFSATNSSAGSNDVDGGNCIVESPVYSVTEASDLSIWYFHGQRDGGDDGGDFFELELSTDGGATYTSLVSIGDVTTHAAWTLATAGVAAGDDVKLRLQVADGTGGGDLIEAGVDDLSICPVP